MSKKKNLRFVIALNLEAKAILELYKLKKYITKKTDFNIFYNSHLNIWLVISGIGNFNSSNATKCLYEESPKSKKNIWINIGMAGSNNYKLGKIFNINKVTFKNNHHYTSALVNHAFPSSEVISVNNVERKFSVKNVLYEMEAYGFIREVEKFCDREQICILKLVSDNKENSPINFVRDTKHFINSNLKEIEKAIDAYIEITSKVIKERKSDLSLIHKKFYLTFSHRVIVSELVVGFEKVYSKKLLRKIINDSNNIKDLIKKLKSKIKVYILKV